MNVSQKIEILKDSLFEPSAFDQILDKLFDVVISKYRNRLKRYKRDLHEFEAEYKLDLAKFYQRFEAGEMGDEMDFFQDAKSAKILGFSEKTLRRL